MVLMMTSFSQESTTDIELWNNFSLTKEIGKKLEVELEEEIRFRENASKLDKLFTGLSAEYEIIKDLEAGLEFRLYRNTKNKGGIEFQKRIRGTLEYSYKLNRFKIGLRTGLQNKDENLWLNDVQTTSSIYNWRNKLSIQYNIPKTKLTPEFSSELFRVYEEEQEAKFNKLRLTLEFRFPILKNTKMELFYRLDKALNIEIPTDTHIIGTGINYTFESKKD